MVSQRTFDIAVSNPDATGTDTAVLFAGKANRLVVTFVANGTVTIPAGSGILTLDFDESFDPNEKALIGASATARALVDNAPTFTITIDPSGRSATVSPASGTLELETDDRIEIALERMTITAQAQPGVDPNFYGRWKGVRSDLHGRDVGANIVVQPPRAAGVPELPLHAEWGPDGGRVAVSAGDSVFPNQLSLHITNTADVGASPLPLKGATFRISVPTMKDTGDASAYDEYDVLCTRTELMAVGATPLTDGRYTWTVNKQANSIDVKPDAATLGWTLAATEDDAVLGPGGSVGVHLAGLVTTLASADYPVVISVQCTVPGYAPKTLRLIVTKQDAILSAWIAISDMDERGRTWPGATVTVKWHAPGRTGLAIKSDPPPANWGTLSRPDTMFPDQDVDERVIHPLETTNFGLSYSGTDVGDSNTMVEVAPLGRVELSGDTKEISIPGAPVRLSSSVEMAGLYSLLPDAIQQIPGGVHQSRTTTVYPLKPTTYTLKADGFAGKDSSNAAISIKRTWDVKVPPLGVTGRFWFGAVDGVWEFDLGAGTLRRVGTSPAGAIVSDLCRLDDQTVLWGYANRDDIGVRLPDGTVLQKDGIGSFSGSYPTGNLVSIAHTTLPGNPSAINIVTSQGWDGIVFAVVRKSDAALLAHYRYDGRGGVIRLRCVGNSRVYGCTDGIQTTLQPDPLDFSKFQEGTVAGVTGPLTTLELAPHNEIYWIGGTPSALMSDGGVTLAAAPKASPGRLCDAQLANGCWGLAIDAGSNVFWFEDVPDLTGVCALVRYDPKAKRRTVVLHVAPEHRPVGGALMAMRDPPHAMISPTSGGGRSLRPSEPVIEAG